jgi:FixJ family two-component response regulator
MFLSGDWMSIDIMADRLLYERGVAIVDDDVDVCESTRFLLEVHGIPSQVFTRGSDFLRVRPLVACLVLDYQMPIANGLEVLQEARKLGILVPAILVTATTDPGLRARAAALGIRQILPKPVGDHLIDALRSELTGNR